MKRRRLGALVGALALLSASRASAETFYAAPGMETAGSTAQQALEQVASENGVPGMSAAVWKGDGIVWSGGTGLANVELDAPVTRESLFRLASVSKTLTATLAARLAQEGKLDLDADVRSYVTTFPDKGHVITSRQLLGHMGGIRHYAGKDFDTSQAGGMIDLRLYPDSDAALALFMDDELVAEPGTKYSYSTFAYTLLATAMERATETPFLELMQRELLDPLGLGHVHPDDLRAVVPGRVAFYDTAQAYLGEPEGTGPHRAFPANVAYKWAGGGLLSTADDLARFGGAQCAPGFLSAASLAEMFTRQRTTGGEEVEVGLGWRIGSDNAGRRIAHHAGSMGGARSVLVVWPDEDVAVSMLSNLSGTPEDILDHATKLGALFLEGE